MATKILILAANPKDTPRVRLDEEVREIEDGLQRAEQREDFILKSQWATRPQDIRRAMLSFNPNIVHFCGHGKGEVGIIFENETGQSQLVSAEALAGFFTLFADTLECVVLNACYSEGQAQAIAQHIDYVIGMSQRIGDKAAIEFAVAFYDALGAGKSLEFAYKLACNAIHMTGILEHLIPVLITRPALVSSEAKSPSKKERKENYHFKKGNIRNPYIVGPPVSDDNFYDRERELLKVLDTDQKLILFIGIKRSGKTSLCYQIQHKCKPDSDYSSNLCVAWSLEGKRDIASAKRRLLSTSNRRILEKADWNRLQNLPNCHKIIETFCETYLRLPEQKTILLLLDEPDSFFLHLAKCGEDDFLTDLKYTFEEIPNLRVVIFSRPSIQELFLYCEIPCLLENFQIEFLREFTDQEAKDLIRQTKRKEPGKVEFGEKLIQEIMEISNRIPFYIQMICSHIFDAFPEKEPHQIIQHIVEQQLFSPYFTSDFNELHLIQKMMLLHLVHSQKPQESRFLIDAVKQIAFEIQGQIPSLRHLDTLVSLGILKKVEKDAYYFSNGLFERWFLRDFDNLWNQTIKKIK